MKPPVRSIARRLPPLADVVSAMIASHDDVVVLLSDFRNLRDDRAVLRSLEYLEALGIVTKIARGVYLRGEGHKPDADTLNQVKHRLGKDAVGRIVVIEGVHIEIGLDSGEAGLAQRQLDEKKLFRAEMIVDAFSIAEIRARSLANLERWAGQGVWVSAFDEWAAIMRDGSDDEVVAAMTGEDERANRLRQSAPYVGLLARPDTDSSGPVK